MERGRGEGTRSAGAVGGSLGGGSDGEMRKMSMGRGCPPIPKAMPMPASSVSANIIQQRIISPASQYLARLIRPSKRNRYQVQSIAQAPKVGKNPTSGPLVDASMGSVRIRPATAR